MHLNLTAKVQLSNPFSIRGRLNVFSVHRTVRAGYPIADFDHHEIETFEQLSGAVTQTVYGAAIWAGGTRRESCFVVAHWCILDFDEGVTKLEAARKLEGFRFLLAPTKSDGKDKVSPSGRFKPAQDRFRVALRWKEPIWNTDVFRFNMRHRIAQFGSDALPYDGGRVWQPSPCVEIVSSAGEDLDVIHTIPVEETAEFQRQKQQQYTASLVAEGSGRLPRHVLRLINGEVIPSLRNDALFKAACTLFQFGWTVEKVRRLVYSVPELADHDKIDSTLKSAAKRTGAAYF
jgi:hypothetical protein